MSEQNYREQVRRDVERTGLKKEQKECVIERICNVLDRVPELHYYQGFHDVAVHCASEDDLEDLALLCLRDFMTPKIEPTLAVLALLPELISIADSRLDAIMRTVPEPHFALAPLLTLFGHNTESNAMLESVQLKVEQYGLGYALYLYTAVMMYRRDEIVEQATGESPEVVHSILSKAGNSLDGIDPDLLFKSADTLRIRIPLSRLPSYRKLSSHSAVKTGSLIPSEQARRDLIELSRPPSDGRRRRIAVAVVVVVVGFLLQRARHP